MGGAKNLPKATYGRALNYMVKSYVGPGCLSLPLAFRHSGIVLGLAMLVILLLAITWNLRCIIVCKIHLEHRGVKSYADLALPEPTRIVPPLGCVELYTCAELWDLVAIDTQISQKPW